MSFTDTKDRIISEIDDCNNKGIGYFVDKDETYTLELVLAL